MKSELPESSPLIIESFVRRLHSRASLSFFEFMDWAMYDHEVGYYRRARKRVGKGKEYDFYTSSSLSPIWGSLIIEACLKLLGPRDPGKFTFVEIAAEPGTGILQDIKHPFADFVVLRLGDSMNIPDFAIVFSNEWLDAQPFRRYRFSHEFLKWTEIYVTWKNNQFMEVENEQLHQPAKGLPVNGRPGDLFDWPCGASKALEDMLCASDWRGLFLTFDYGLNLNVLLEDRAFGTARSYFKHRMEPNLLLRPTEQDITCHLCWDEIRELLEIHGFNKCDLQTQECFLMTHASQGIRAILEEQQINDFKKRSALKELLHPAHLGHGIQALSAYRE